MAGIAEGGFTWTWKPCEDNGPHPRHPHGLTVPGGPFWCVGLLPDGSRPSGAFRAAAASTMEPEAVAAFSDAALAVWADRASVRMGQTLGIPSEDVRAALMSAMRESGIVR